MRRVALNRLDAIRLFFLLIQKETKKGAVETRSSHLIDQLQFVVI